MRTVATALAIITGCTTGGLRGEVLGPDLGDVTVTDVGGPSGYQDFFFGAYKRGRGNVVADFDGDGDFDVFTANPRSRSYLLRNDTREGGPIHFTPWQILSEDELFYGGVAADFDNDGDQDLFVATGANDGSAPDRLFRNDGDPDRPLVDVSAGQSLVPRSPDGTPEPTGTMGARAFDVDNDGMLDVWASNFVLPPVLDALDPSSTSIGLNQLYLNRGFELVNVAASTGLQRSRGATRHSSVLDFDRDGDMDIYENNFVRRSVLWENQLADRGGLGFLNATAKRDLVGDGSIGGPRADQAMCSIASDLNNDGWQDLVLLHRGRDEPGSTDGHQVLINVEGTGFVDVAEHTGISDTWHERTEPPTMGGPMGIGWGVMGCQVGDVDLDGFPDVYVGTGVGSVGDVDRLFVSRGRVTVSIEGVGDVVVPQFENWTSLVDFPADPVDGAPTVPYPYRTHGTALADFDGDGVPEIGVHNGGPAAFGFIEPNRLFKLDLPDPRFLRIRLVGNGRTVNRDGVGAEVVVTAYREWDRHEWELHQYRQSATGFGAQNESDLVFGLADADEVSQIVVNWPDGTSQQVTPPEGTANWMVVQQP